MTCQCGCGQRPKTKKARFVWGHALRTRKTDPEKWAKLKDGLATWRGSPEGKATNKAAGEKRGRYYQTPEGKAKLVKALTGREQATTAKASFSPGLREIEWAAGFLEGEGSFSVGRAGDQHVSAHQVNPEPLLKMARFFGGNIHCRVRKNPRYQPVHVWQVSGGRARGIAMTLYALMSTKRKNQIKEMLNG